ncbi:MAG: hypothetical protein ACREJC_06110, partial [Tepidisphaeraceae bacterium]
MPQEQAERVREIFDELADLSPDERSSRLAAIADTDPGVLDEVKILFEAHERVRATARPPEHQLKEQFAQLDLAEDPILPPGTLIADFTTVGVIGRGGMGVVYKAEQHRPRRFVALKLIRPGFATPQMLRRFEFEADLLGRLDHPGIATIHGAGIADTSLGRQPFFAMELVEGLPLNE